LSAKDGAADPSTKDAATVKAVNPRQNLPAGFTAERRAKA
jgi:hypothetical protein